MAATSSDEVGRLYPVARAVLSPVFRGLWRMRVEGLEHVPTEGGVIFCPNHVSVLDSFFLPLALPRQIKFVGKAEYMDSWKTRHLFPALGMIPIDRGGGSAAERALSAAARVLEEGGYFGIYPEGTRSRDGRLHRGHTGPARLALRTGCPIVPVGLIGTREVQPPDARLPRPFKPVVVRFGRPIDVRRHADRADDRLVLRQIIDEVMYEIRELSGQENVDEYATKKAEGFPSAAPARVDVDATGAPTSSNGERAHRRSSAEVLAPPA
ncbi:MAG TPA: lysophospholipid acyltransferase family protein [Acidimicrobiales bacterium]|nr:lysophospholipid acyltransferase family protein [Acidimicrobiales bacterium]